MSLIKTNAFSLLFALIMAFASLSPPACAWTDNDLSVPKTSEALDLSALAFAETPEKDISVADPWKHWESPTPNIPPEPPEIWSADLWSLPEEEAPATLMAGDSNKCGEKVTWNLDNAGELFISGEGDMYDYASVSDTPWYSQRSSIQTISITNGVTSVGSYAFPGASNLKEVKIHGTLRKIGEYAFHSCVNLNTVFYSQTNEVLSIGTAAFFGCEKLNRLTSSLTSGEDNFPSGVTDIGEATFYKCAFEKVVLPDTLTSIGLGAFAVCPQLKEIVLPSKITEIPKMLLGSCASLETVRLNGAVKSVGPNAFNGCPALKDVYYGGSRAQWDAIQWDRMNFYVRTAIVHFSDNSSARMEIQGTFNKTLTWTLNHDGLLAVGGNGDMEFNAVTDSPWFSEYPSVITAIRIENGVTSVGKFAFTNVRDDNYYQYDALQSVEIASSVKTIGYGAFAYLPVKKITLSNGLSKIEDYAFLECGVESVVIPGSVGEIGQQTFQKCANLKRIVLSEGVPMVSAGMCMECPSLTEVSLPSSVTSMGDSAFQDCTALEEIKLPDKLTVLSVSPFFGCSALREITLSGNLTSIGVSAFGNCSSLHDIWFGGDAAAWNRVQVGAENTVIPKVTVHMKDGSALGHCGDNLAWAFSNGIVSIQGDGNMYNYSPDTHPWTTMKNEIRSVDIAQGAASIGSAAFYECAMETVSIPSSVASIGVGAFYRCAALKNITLPDAVTSLGYGTFAECDHLEWVRVSDKFTEIGEMTFKDSPRLTAVFSKAGETLPGGLTALGQQAFDGCESFSEVSIPAGVKSPGIGAFISSGLKSAEIPAGVEIPNLMFGMCNKLERLSIASGVTGIGTMSFSNCVALKEVSIPGSVGEIGQQAFEMCGALERLSIASGVTKIGLAAFRNCVRLTEVEIPASVKELADGVFYECSALRRATISKAPEVMKISCFQNCPKLESVKLPADLTQIPDYTFSGCSALKGLSIPAGVKSVGVGAFKESGLVCVIVPDGVTKISENAFSSCEQLRALYLPSSLSSVGEGAFEQCDALSAVLYPGTKEDWNRVNVDASGNGAIAEQAAICAGSVKTQYCIEGVSGALTACVIPAASAAQSAALAAYSAAGKAEQMDFVASGNDGDSLALLDAPQSAKTVKLMIMGADFAPLSVSQRSVG